MSFFSEASLAMIPSGYKTSKVYSALPITGDGDLTFSRSNDTATRVGPDGLIEKVRTNIVTYSEDFANAAWTKNNASITSNAIANPLNGALTADLVTATANVGYVSSTAFAFAAVPYTISMYAKKSNVDWVSIEASDGVANSSKSWYNIANGTLGTTGGTYTILNRTITSVGNGWYRLTLTFSVTVATNYSFVPFFVASDGALSVTGNAGYAFGTQVEVSDFGATDYIATTSAAVSVGPVANVPRLDYLNSSCPRLLLEPQRTNDVTYSEQFTNAVWTGSGGTVVDNQAVSPDGYTNADLIYPSTSGNFAGKYQNVGAATTGVLSCYVKQAGKRFAQLGTDNNATYTCAFDLQLGTVVRTATNYTATITSVGNGWFRITAAYVSSAAAAYPFVGVSDNANGAVTVDGTNGLYVWGFQYERSASYATSYIPTLGAAVTRGADVTSKSGISSLIGQTNGTAQMTFVMDSDTSADSTTMLGIHAGTSTANRIQLLSRFGTVRLLIVANSSIITNDLLYDAAPNEVVNVAFKYGSAGVTAYINGTQVYTTASAVVFTETMELFTIGSRSGVDEYGKGQRVSQSLLFPTALSNSDLAALTA